MSGGPGLCLTPKRPHQPAGRPGAPGHEEDIVTEGWPQAGEGLPAARTSQGQLSGLRGGPGCRGVSLGLSQGQCPMPSVSLIQPC